MSNIEHYEAGVAAIREAFVTAPAVRAIQDAAIGADALESFFIHFCALGVGMTEPVEGWIRRAGEACVALESPDLRELGMALQGHAKAEADHHLLMIADLSRLCAGRTTAERSALVPEALLAAPWPASVHRYRELHERVIAGDEPYSQIAIENEIEMISVTVGPGLLANAERLLGTGVLDNLSFLTSHVTLDVAHTEFNRRQLARFLDERPTGLRALVEAGTAALDTYRDFLTDCLALARATSRHG